MAEPAYAVWTVEEFLDWEATQAERYEFVHGQVRAMVGASSGHNRIAMNLSLELGIRLRGSGCSVWSHAEKLKINNQVFYPDVFVTCDRITDADRAAEDAVLIAEVLSPSTWQYDLAAKSPLYRSLPSLRHLLFISQDAIQVEAYSREARGWHLDSLAAPDDGIDLSALDMTLRLDDLYRDTELLNGR